MPTVLLSRGQVAKLTVRHGESVIRIIGTSHTATPPVRIVLTLGERDALVAALTSPPVDTLSVVDLVLQGEFARIAGHVRYAHDAEDRIQDAVAQAWHAAARREADGHPLPGSVIKWVFRKRVQSQRDRFVPRRASRGGDTLDPRLTPLRSSGFDPETTAMTGYTPEELCLIKETLLALDATDQVVVGLRLSGHSLAEVGAMTGTSLATAHRRENRIAETIRGW